MTYYIYISIYYKYVLLISATVLPCDLNLTKFRGLHLEVGGEGDLGGSTAP